MVSKLSLVACVIVAGLSPTAASANASTVIEHRSGTATSPSTWDPVDDQEWRRLDLADGFYSLKLMASGFGDIAWAWSSIDAYTKAGKLLGNVVDIWRYNHEINFDETVEFSITGAADKYFIFASGVIAQNGTTSYSTTLSRITAVPGPEAGAGLGFGLAGALSVWLARRDKRLRSDQE